MMLRRQYEKQLMTLYKKFGEKTVPPLLDLVRQHEPQHRVIQQQDKKTMGIIDDISRWLRVEIDQQVTNPARSVVDRNMTQAYKKGIKKANRDMKIDHVIPGHDMMPLDYEALVNIQEINMNRIKDCNTSMHDAITYSCSKGITQGWGVDRIAYEIRRNIEGNQNMGIVRARTIARTEIIDAYNTATDNRYKAMGLKDKDIVWITAFDERTCEECVDNDGKNIEEIGERPPIHPNCRCSITGVPPEE